MQPDSILFLKALKYVAISLGALMVAGIAFLMFISWDKDEDITGIVAPALLIVIVSVIAAIVTAILQWRAEKQLDQKY
jgi:ABC-type polysaccharide/polyol phosphate export permease